MIETFMFLTEKYGKLGYFDSGLIVAFLAPKFRHVKLNPVEKLR